MHLIFQNRSDRVAEVAAAVVARIDAFIAEAQVPRVARDVRVERRRPVAAARTLIEETRRVAAARRRQENELRIVRLVHELITGDTVIIGYPLVVGIIYQLGKLLHLRHAPGTAPVGTCRIVGILQLSLVVGSDGSSTVVPPVTTLFFRGAILGEGELGALAPCVGVP